MQDSHVSNQLISKQSQLYFNYQRLSLSMIFPEFKNSRTRTQIRLLQLVIKMQIIAQFLIQNNISHTTQHKQIMFGNLQDEMLKAYVEKIFDKYDTDKSGTLDQKEMTVFFNELFKSLGIMKEVTLQESVEAIKSIDQNYDGNINKQELLTAFKAMLMKSQQQAQMQAQMQAQQQQQQQMMMSGGGYGQQPYGYNPYGGYGGYPPPNPYGGYPPQGYYPQSPYYPQQQPPMYSSQPNMYNNGNRGGGWAQQTQPQQQQQGYGGNPYGNQGNMTYSNTTQKNPYQK